MTKAKMIEIILKDAVSKKRLTDSMIAMFGEDSQEAKECRSKWSESLSLVVSLELLDEYLEKLNEL